MELRSFYKEIKRVGETISKAGYSKQRSKLNPQALQYLADFRAKNFYRDKPLVQRLKGYLVFAADGSAINLPNTKENYEKYGSASRNNTKPQAQIGLGCMFDVLNKMIVGSSIHKVKFSERECALNQMDHAEELAGTTKVIYVFDRGYPSGEIFLDLANRGTKYLIRLASSDFKAEQKAMTSHDEWVDIVFTKARVSVHRRNGKIKTAEKMEEAQKITVRFVHIYLDNGEEEYLATNLPFEEFQTKDFKYLYHLRWEIETAFDVLKNKLQVENFTGTKPIIIEQDIYASVYLCNIMHDMAMEAQKEYEDLNHKKYKYRMLINKNIASGLLKEEIIRFVLAKSTRKKMQIFNGIMEEMKENLVPVREERHFTRTKGKLAGKYSNVNKRAY